jgi:hypothetical protein
VTGTSYVLGAVIHWRPPPWHYQLKVCQPPQVCHPFHGRRVLRASFPIMVSVLDIRDENGILPLILLCSSLSLRTFPRALGSTAIEDCVDVF